MSEAGDCATEAARSTHAVGAGRAPPAPKRGASSLIRACKVALVAMVALLFALVAFGNITDYGSNQAFVQHVLAMDSIFPGSTLGWRAVTDPRLQTLAYAGIIGWQVLTALVLTFGAIRLFVTIGSPEAFAAAKPLAALGLTMGLLLYGVGFTIIGGEWFAMWQSQTWNGLDSAARFILLDGLVLLVLLAADGPP
jgi:predicted small integral membrane protein